MAPMNRLRFFSGYFFLLVLVALNAAVQEAAAEKETLIRLRQNVGAPTLKFLYWYVE